MSPWGRHPRCLLEHLMYVTSQSCRSWVERLTVEQEPPAYMKDNVNNYFGSAPDKGSMTGPILGALNATTLAEIHGGNDVHTVESRQNTDGFWLSSLGSEGQVRS